MGRPLSALTIQPIKATISGCNFRFQTMQEAQDIANFISMLSSKPEQVQLALYEILVNAVEHGNLGIKFLEKHELMKNGNWMEEIERRSDLPENQKKFVEVEVQIDANMLQCTVTDCGEGFDYKKHYKIDSSNNQYFNGRGIAIVKEMGADEMDYVEPGNKVVLRFFN